MVMVMVVRMISIVVMIVIVATIVVVVVSAVVIMFVLIKSLFDLLGEALLGNSIDFADRDAAFGGHLGAGFKFRSEQRTFAMSPTKLALEQTERRFDDAGLSRTL